MLFLEDTQMTAPFGVVWKACLRPVLERGYLSTVVTLLDIIYGHHLLSADDARFFITY